MVNLISCSIGGLVLFFIISTFLAAELPKDWTRCHLKRTEANECIRKAVEDAIVKLKDGSKDLAVSPLEPLLIPALTIGAGSGPVNVVQHFKDIKLHGLTGSKVLSGSVELENNLLIARSITPMLRLEANYKMQGRILFLPVYGEGPCNVTLINTAINHTLYGMRTRKNGKEFLSINNYSVTLYPEKVVFKFDNFFNGNKKLGDEINKVLNENQDAVFADVRSGYEQSFGLIFQDLANKVFGKVGLTDIFLD